MKLKKEYIDNNNSIAIVGSSDSGKTNFAVYCASQCSHLHKYILGYPKDIKGFIRIFDKDELFRLKNCVIVIDEFWKYFRRYGRNHNDALEEAINFSEHRNIKLILTSQTNQEIDRNLESRIKVWVLKRINIHTLKQGGMCKIALQSIKHSKNTSSFLNLENNECLWYNIDSIVGENGIYEFTNMGIKKDWDENVKENVKENVR